MLVALAIFGTVMAGISIVFLSSLRAWHASRETQSVFEMGRAALRVMEQDITTAFGSVDRGELRTLVGGPDWLSFVGITENPKTSPNPAWDPTPHSDISRITYYLWREAPGSDEHLLLRLVQLDVDDVGTELVDIEGAVIPRTVAEWEASVGTDVVPTDFELASNILSLTIHYGMVGPGGAVAWADGEPGDPDGVDNDRDGIIDEQGDGLDNDGDGFVDERDEGWNSLLTGKLPEVIEVHLAVRAEAKVVTAETKERVFRETIFLPLGYRRPLPAALQ